MGFELTALGRGTCWGGIRERSYRFALEIISFCRKLKKDREYELARQLLRSGTSIGANVDEASAGSSRADFAHKMTIASKEARESRYWLRLITDSGLARGEKPEQLLIEVNALVNILTAIVKSTDRNTANKNR